MRRLTENERRDWMYGTGRKHRHVQALIGAEIVTCDDCDDTALTIGHGGEGTRVRVLCPTCWRKQNEARRATRPSRDELMARVNEAVYG